MDALKIKKYDLIGKLEEEEDALDSFDEHSGYIDDVISEIAESHTPIYDSEVWENVSKLQEHIEEAIASGLVSTEGDVDLLKIFRAGYYEYFSRTLNNNKDILCYNYVANKLNDFFKDMGEDEANTFIFEEIEQAVEEGVNDIDRYDELEDVLKDIIERLVDFKA